MKTKYMFIVAAMTAMLIDSIVLVMDDAFADKKRHDDKKKGGYEKSQAIGQSTYCGNSAIAVAIFCQDIGSQTQGMENSVAQAGNQEINIGVGLGGEPNGEPPTFSLLDESTSSVISEEPQ
jgi:hypothetical protein